ncbi:unnamed protein product [Wickerhamomyces anomalus]
MAIREDLVQNAVSFLRDPQVSSAALDKKIEFLKSKSLSEEEIQEALKRSNGEESAAQDVTSPSQGAATPTAAGQSVATAAPPHPQYYTARPPPVPERDWKDYFIMATATVGVGYALYEITKRYVIPNILPASKSKLDQDKAAIEEEFLRIEATLKEISNTNKELKENEETKAKEISKTIDEVADIINLTETKNEKIESDVKYLKSEIENLKNSLDRSIDKQQNTISLEINTLQTELKSLQQLIKSRNNLTTELSNNKSKSPIPSVSSIPSASEILKKANLSNGSSTPTSPETSGKEVSNNAPKIPAWQQQQQQPSSIPAWQQANKSNASSLKFFTIYTKCFYSSMATTSKIQPNKWQYKQFNPSMATSC